MLGAFCLSVCGSRLLSPCHKAPQVQVLESPPEKQVWSFFSWAAAGVCNAQKRSLSPLSGPSHVLGTQLLAQGVCSGRC